MEQHNRKFAGIWIPAEIWLNENLSLSEKILLAEIKNYDQVSGCKNTNQDFADFLNTSTSTIQRIIKNLNDLGLISLQYNEHQNERTIKFLKS
jgi:DNA-binding MarR family transcriptional regulator